MSLPGSVVERLEAALLDAFHDDDALDALLRRLGVQAQVPARAPLATRVGKLVEVVDAQGGVVDLIEAARGLAPGNAAIAQIQTVILAEMNGVAPSSRPTRELAPPKPVYPDADVQARAERLREAQGRQTTLRNAGLATDEVDREVLQRRRELREGGQLHAGDDVGGRYLLIEKIGRGGFAVVWKAHDKAEQRAVAVKVLHSNLAGDPLRRERFFRGAKAMLRLAHPAVVRVLEPRGEDGGFCYFVMELMTGGNLREAVLERRIARANVLPLIVQVGEALAKAHANRLIHRDVKPSNVVLDERGDAKLTDFDLVAAHDTTGGTRTGALGTVVYAAPECLDKPQDATARADVYGLGMTAIFCLLGQELPTFMLRNPQPTIVGLDCSWRVRKVLERAVAWEAKERFADAARMLDALSSALEADRAPAQGEHRDGPGSATPSRRRDQPSDDKPIAALRFISGKYQGGEFPLRRHREIVLGRSSEVDMPLIEDMVSRRHAKIGSTDSGMYVEDIGSTNGTFVNGERITGRALLSEGDRILIGTSIIRINRVEGELGNQSEAEALRLLEAGAQRREAMQGRPMSGMIEVIPLPDLLRLLSTSRNTGVLTVNSGVTAGRVYLRDGTLYFATINDDFDLGPQKSLFRMLRWNTGTFYLESGIELVVPDEVRVPTDALLSDGLREIDEWRTLAVHLPGPSTTLIVPTPLPSRLRSLAPEELDIVQLVLDHGRVQKVLDGFAGTDVEAATHLVNLMRREFVVDPRTTGRSAAETPVAIPESIRTAVIEGLLQVDEFRTLQAQLPPLTALLAVPTPLAQRLRELTASELDTFQHVLDHGEVRMVLSSSPDAALAMAHSLVRLIQAKLVVVP